MMTMMILGLFVCVIALPFAVDAWLQRSWSRRMRAVVSELGSEPIPPAKDSWDWVHDTIARANEIE